jgi:hypothetical protein
MNLVAVWGLETADSAGSPRSRRRDASPRHAKTGATRSGFSFPATSRGFSPRPLPPRDLQTTRKPPGPCLIRGAVDLALVRALEAAGWRCVNPSRAIEVATDKLETQRLLDALGIPTPRAWLASDPARPRATESRPLVAKPRFGSRGAGVRLVRGEEEIAAIVGGDDAIPADRLLLQDFVAASQGRDLRAFFASDRVVAVAERRARRARSCRTRREGARASSRTSARDFRPNGRTSSSASRERRAFRTGRWIFSTRGEATRMARQAIGSILRCVR